jgi:hypothetical protein
MDETHQGSSKVCQHGITWMYHSIINLCHLHHGRNSSSNHHTSIMSETHGSKASYGMGSNHMHQWRLWRHKASPGCIINKSSISIITINQTIKRPTFTSIDLAASYCDHCEAHHQVSRVHITVVVIKDNHQAGVGINDKLYQQSPPLSLMTTTHAPPKSMLPSESLSPFGINGKGWHQLHHNISASNSPYQHASRSSDSADLCRQLSHLLTLTFGFLHGPKVLKVWTDLKLGCSHDNHRLYIDHATVLSSSSTLVLFPIPCLLLKLSLP